MDEFLKGAGLSKLGIQIKVRSALSEFLREMGIKEEPEIKVEGARILIYCADPILRQELSLRKEKIKEFLEKKLGSFKIETIQIKAGGE